MNSLTASIKSDKIQKNIETYSKRTIDDILNMNGLGEGNLELLFTMKIVNKLIEYHQVNGFLKIQNYELKVIERLKVKIVSDYINIRKNIDGDIKDSIYSICWIVIIKLHYILCIHEQKGKTVIQEEKNQNIFAYSEPKFDTIVYGDISKNNYCFTWGLSLPKFKVISRYTCKTLWDSITRLLSKFNYLPYDKELERFIYLLVARCGELSTQVFKNCKVLNRPEFCTEKFGGYTINNRFILDTERDFMEIIEVIEIRKRSILRLSNIIIRDKVLQSYDIENRFEADPELCIKFLKWIELWIVVFNEFMYREFKLECYSPHVYPGEVKRYLNEKKMANATGFIVISELRPKSVEILAEWMESRNAVKIEIDRQLEYFKKKSLKKEHITLDISDYGSEKNEESDISKVYFNRANDLRDQMTAFRERFFQNNSLDIDVPLIIRIFFKYYSKAKVGSTDLRKFIITREMLPSFNHDGKYAYIVQTFNEYSIITKDRNWIFCKDFISCIVQWMKLNAEDSETNGNLEGEYWNFKYIYKVVFEGSPDLQGIAYNSDNRSNSSNGAERVKVEPCLLEREGVVVHQF